jgi:tetratricopeptide (TPR) repeat protein
MIGLKPKEPDAYLSLALLYEKQGQLDKAQGVLDEMVAADPHAVRQLLYRAEFRRNHGEFGTALADCDRAAQLDPKSALPDLVRASILAARGEARAAVELAEPALKRAPPHDGRALCIAAKVWSLAARAAKSPEAARSYTERAIGLLTEVYDKGFHDLIYPEHNRLAEDPALAPIRDDPRVRDLLSHR